MSGPNKPPPSSEQKFVNRFVSSLVQWVPLGGSGWAFASFLLQQDWMTSMLLFPVTAVSGVWAAYSRNFIERLSEIYAERGREHANALDQGIKSLNEALKWQFSGFEGKYLQLQAHQVSEYLTEGFNPDRTAIPLLEEVYVPLELSGTGIQTSSEREILSEKELERGVPQSQWIWDFIRRSQRESQFRQIVIQAKGGFGKTTLLRHLAWMYGQGKYKKFRVAKRIPFLLHLRDWRETLIQSNPPKLADLIYEYIAALDSHQTLKIPPQWVEQTLNGGEALVMLDGFDEIPEDKRGAVSHWISAEMKGFGNATFILTSRPEGYKDYEARKPRVPVFVQKFSLEQQSDFVNRWYRCQEQCFRSQKQAKLAQRVAGDNAKNLLDQIQDPERPELQQMAENPLLLNMLATYHRFDTGVELPRKRVELYKGICKLQLEDRPRARGIAMSMEREKSQRVLQRLALTMVNANRASVSWTDLTTFLRSEPILNAERVQADDFLAEQIGVSELLVEREAKEYEFPHLSFQGYLAAVELNLGEYTAQILANWDKSWWKETILLYTSQLSPLTFSEVIQNAYEISEPAAELAAQCFREYQKPDKLDEILKAKLTQLASNVQRSVFAELERLLETGQWKAADGETYRLMITTVGKEHGQFFSRDELLNFPCEDLLAIDALWVKHSSGKFGFSVQKDLYLKCGGVADGAYDHETFKKFIREVKWSSKILYELDRAPCGHLPLIFFQQDLFSDLFSRVQTCKV